MKRYCTYWFLVYAEGVVLLGGTIHTVKENAEILVLARKEIGIEVYTDKTMYMVISRDQNESHSKKFENRTFEGVEEFKYLEQTYRIRIPCEKKLIAD